MHKKLGIALFLVFLCSFSGKDIYGQKDNKDEKPISIEACRVPLTDIGRRASFQGTAVYRVKTGKQGKITSIDPISIPDFFRAMLQLDLFECCIRHWRLHPSAEYSIALQAGTTGETLNRWLIVVKEKAGSTIKIVLASTSDCKESGGK
jgi:hypothetical protein